MTGEVDHLVGEAPLVVVPGDELDKVIVQSDAGTGVEDGGVGVGAEVGGDDVVINVLQNTLHGAFGGGLHGSADLIIGGGLLEAEGHVNNGHIRSGDTHGHTGELAVELGDDLADSLGSASGGGDDVVVDGACAAQILLLGEAVNNGLGGGRGMDGGHEAFDNAEVVIDDLGDRGQAVGGAGSVGNELHVGGVLVQVDAADEHGGVVLCGAGHDDDLGAGIDMSLGLLLGQVNAGALEHVLNTQLTPGDEGSVAVGLIGEDLDGLAVDGDGAVLVVADDFAVEAAVDGIVLHAVSDVGSGMTGSADGNNLDIVRLDSGAERQGADAAETIDANFDHVFYPPIIKIVQNLPTSRPPRMRAKNACHSLLIITYTILKNQVQPQGNLIWNVTNFCRIRPIISC